MINNNDSVLLEQYNMPATLSLLWPPDDQKRPLHPNLHDISANDLGLANTILYFYETHSRQTEKILRHLSSDTAVIRYRQDILEDMLNHPQLTAKFRELLPVFDLLAFRQFPYEEQKTILYEVMWRTSELEGLVESVQGLSSAFSAVGDNLQSAGLCLLRDTIINIEQDPEYQTLVQELPGFLDTLRSIRSVTIGVNLDSQLRPYQATLLAVNKEPFSGATLLTKLLGKSNNQQWRGLAELHTVDSSPREYAGSTDFAVTNTVLMPEPKMVPLFRDLAQVLEKVGKPILKALNQYERINGRFLLNLRDDLTFYLGAVRLIELMKTAGLPMCRPTIAEKEARLYEVTENYNINLALHLTVGQEGQDITDQVVRNDVEMGGDGRLFILTGPNQGGKTTYIQAIGLTHILAQAGLYVPGTQATISPVDNIYTHYPSEEVLERGTGRFGDEAERLSHIFSQATRHSLLLFNESLSGTNMGEALYLAQDIVRILRRLGTRAIFATHMHELAESVPLLNEHTTGDSLAISMVASLIEKEHQDGLKAHSYKVIPSPPMGRSYARELAAQYGVSYEQLETLLQKRGILRGLES